METPVASHVDICPPLGLRDVGVFCRSNRPICATIFSKTFPELNLGALDPGGRTCASYQILSKLATLIVKSPVHKPVLGLAERVRLVPARAPRPRDDLDQSQCLPKQTQANRKSVENQSRISTNHIQTGIGREPVGNKWINRTISSRFSFCIISAFFRSANVSPCDHSHNGLREMFQKLYMLWQIAGEPTPMERFAMTPSECATWKQQQSFRCAPEDPYSGAHRGYTVLTSTNTHGRSISSFWPYGS